MALDKNLVDSIRPPVKKIRDVVIRLAGNSQDGIQAIGSFLARLAGRTAKEVMTFMTIPATISGGPSIYQVRLGTGEVLSAGDDVDVLVAFYQHSYQEHIGSLRENGLLLYDSDQVKLDDGEKKYRAIGLPVTSTLVEAAGGSAKGKGKNMFMLGLLTRMFDLDRAKLEGMLQSYYKKKGDDVWRNVLNAFHAGYAYDIGRYTELYQFEPAVTPTASRVVMDGNQAIAFGAITAGVRFGAGYPITPATSIMEILRAELPKYGGMFVQCEDEIAAIGAACGASYAGQVALTSTSGPGLSLKTELLGWAVMAEIPLVVVDVQRGGPATGMPTKTEQSDLFIACFGSHGDAPRIVLAPVSVEDCFYTTIEAVNLARQYNSPVIILSDQALSTRVETWDMPDLKSLVQDIAPKLAPASEARPYQDTADGIAHHFPPGTLMIDGKYPVVTGLEHDEWGHPAGHPFTRAKMVAKRRRKLQTLARRLPKAEVFGAQSGEVLFIGWGSTCGPIREAARRAQAAGQSVSALMIRYLMPLQPGIEDIINNFKHIFVVELNDEGLYGSGQLATLLRARFVTDKIRSINKADGLSFRVRDILAQLKQHLAPAAEQSN